MPYGNEKSLSANEVYAITAYVLYLNEIVPELTTLTANNLPTVVMPNHDGFHTPTNYEPLNVRSTSLPDGAEKK